LTSYGFGINDSGQVVGESFTATNAHAFLYSGTPGAGGSMADLGTLGGAGSGATGINNFGEVVGASDTRAFGIEHAFAYFGTPGSGGRMVDLGTLGGSDSGANAVNDKGEITGDSNLPGDNASHAFIRTPDLGMVDIGTLGGTNSIGFAIDSAGQIVGQSGHAFVYIGTPGVDGTWLTWMPGSKPTIQLREPSGL
jgi:probable HAF family extracellular repeat protein